MKTYSNTKNGMEKEKRMKTLLRLELKKISIPVLLTALVTVIAMSVLSCTLYRDYGLQYDLEAWEVGTEIFTLIYPLIVVIPLCWNLYHERKNNFLVYVMPRVELKRYISAKWIAYALGTLCLITVPYIISAMFALYIKPAIEPCINPFHHVFQVVFIKTPLLYAVAISCWKGVVSLLIMTFGFVLALYCKNVFVIMTGPFIYTVLENFILSILKFERYRLVVCFDPTSISSVAVTSLSFIVGPLLLGIVICLAAFLLSRKNAIVAI